MSVYFKVRRVFQSAPYYVKNKRMEEKKSIFSVLCSRDVF